MYTLMMKDFNKIANILRSGLDLLNDPALSPLMDDAISIENEQQNTVRRIAVPGCSKDDIRVTKKGDKLLIYIKDELKKSYYLTKSVDKENIKTTVKDGVLTIDLSKAFESDEEEIEIS